VGREPVDVGECGVRYARGRMAVMEHFANVVSTVAQDLKPLLRDRPQLIRVIFYPGIDGRIALDRTGESHEPSDSHCAPKRNHNARESSREAPSSRRRVAAQLRASSAVYRLRRRRAQRSAAAAAC
jgi:hypothetical protein